MDSHKQISQGLGGKEERRIYQCCMDPLRQHLHQEIRTSSLEPVRNALQLTARLWIEDLGDILGGEYIQHTPGS